MHIGNDVLSRIEIRKNILLTFKKHSLKLRLVIQFQISSQNFVNKIIFFFLIF